MGHKGAENWEAREDETPFAFIEDRTLPLLIGVDACYKEHWNKVDDSVDKQAPVAATGNSTFVEPSTLNVFVLSENFPEDTSIILFLVIVIMRHIS